MSENVNIKSYFERIGFSGSMAPSLTTLEQIHALHPAAIPFENLDPIIGLPVLLDQKSLEQKLLHHRRGGFCFEHNTLLMRALTDLDYKVRAYAARVLWGHDEGDERPLSHMVLVVDIAGASYLADVGFGGLTLTTPLKLRADMEQKTANETFRLLTAGEGLRLEVLLESSWKPVYQFDLVERSEPEIVELCVAIAADHHDHHLLIAARAEKDARYNLLRNRLTIHRHGQPRERRDLLDVDGLRSALTDIFNIALPPADLLDPALARVVEMASKESV